MTNTEYKFSKLINELDLRRKLTQRLVNEQSELTSLNGKLIASSKRLQQECAYEKLLNEQMREDTTQQFNDQIINQELLFNQELELSEAKHFTVALLDEPS